MNEADLEGEVCSGLGEGRRFTQLDWALREFADKLGMVPHPGTLNLRMVDPRWAAVRDELNRRSGTAITTPAGFCGARCFAARLSGSVTASVVLPSVPDYPDDKLELLAAVPLRTTLRLADGDRVRLRIDY